MLTAKAAHHGSYRYRVPAPLLPDVLPRGFVRIRYFGYLASAHRTALPALARLQLAGQPQHDLRVASSQLATWRCPRCGANMCIGPNLTAQQLAFRCKLSDTS